MVATCNTKTVGLSQKYVGRVGIYSFDQEQDPAIEAPMTWLGRKLEDKKKVANVMASL